LVIVRYYNISFLLKIKEEEELTMFQYFAKRISDTPTTMREIALWCRAHGIEFETKFKWREDFKITANLWNFYSYLRFRLEDKLLGTTL